MLSTLKNSAKWCIGSNNFSAIRDVFQNEYIYSTGDPSRLMRIKQIGTEILHAGLKWGILGALADKTLVSLNLLPQPTPNSCHELIHRIIHLPDIPLNEIIKIEGFLGIGSILYAGYASIKKARALLNNFKQVFENKGSRIRFSKDQFKQLIGNTIDLAALSPIYFGSQKFGFAGAATTSLIFAAGDLGCKLADKADVYYSSPLKRTAKITAFVANLAFLSFQRF